MFWIVDRFLLIFWFGISILGGRAFRCFSEYEFSWWDGAGIYHINAFSMSHFQLKMATAFRLNETSRYPVKEAYFLTKLHPTYLNTVRSDCSHALVLAHLVVSLMEVETSPLETAIEHYREAIKIYNEAERIHQEVTSYAWPFREALKTTEAAIVKQQSVVEVRRNVTLVILGDNLRPSISSILARRMSKFSVSRLMTREPLRNVTREIHGLFNSSQVLFSDRSDCETYLFALSQIPHNMFPVIFLDNPSELESTLFERYMRFLVFGRSSIPEYFSFGADRSLPRLVGDSILRGSYSGSSFAVGNRDLILNIDQKGTCSLSDKPGVIFDNLVRRQPALYSPLRCDDENLPVGLRLCRGDEASMTDWRSTILGPVHPRHPVGSSN
jgi:hypothetical protein